jgi:hypothetical protein
MIMFELMNFYITEIDKVFVQINEYSLNIHK